MENGPKQIIVMRKDLGMRKGKMIAQGAHASMKAILDLMYTDIGAHDVDRMILEFRNTEALGVWLTEPSRNSDIDGVGFKKVCVYVNSEEELLDLYQKAKDAGIICALITDSGATEFHGQATNTCIAIGPGWPEKIDPITGHLKLL